MPEPRVLRLACPECLTRLRVEEPAPDEQIECPVCGACFDSPECDQRLASRAPGPPRDQAIASSPAEGSARTRCPACSAPIEEYDYRCPSCDIAFVTDESARAPARWSGPSDRIQGERTEVQDEAGEPPGSSWQG
jgi:hypothetical protein